ncbi:nuclear transport factor 2 family protein [Aliiroseovarius subalbicans]|uniref:nuclear transport factor 2 family protein n=1 Tax=Aliiroseovarius subalbicans TaxID=2925840 RepID=UPI001F5813C5|nr:nuclear transport factor 2 family protein [Aliiroseovarius subalbicans]MCI2401123.1 nuclear transport factor 2 family protein [Aliiroseovarius subalbicans]
MGKPSFQDEKKLVRDYYARLDAASPDGMKSAQAQYVATDYLWRGFHPFHEIRCAEGVVDQFWTPLKTALSHMQRRMDVFMAGQNTIEDQGGVWVVSMGHLMGLFDQPWLGIPPTGKMAMLRYCEFHKVEAGKITETAMFFDIPHLMMQAGLDPFPPQTAAHLVQPGPMTHDGLMFEAQDPGEGRKTLAAIDHMVSDIKTWRGGVEEPLVDELRRSWNEDMIWWGPAGIGATYTIERYAQQHSGPFRAGLTDRSFNGHICRIVEGQFGGFFGWPNLTLTPAGGFMGMPATNTPGDMRVIDIYRRDGDKLTENWIFIDLLHFWNMQGIDILARTTNIAAGQETGARGAAP